MYKVDSWPWKGSDHHDRGKEILKHLVRLLFALHTLSAASCLMYPESGQHCGAYKLVFVLGYSVKSNSGLPSMGGQHPFALKPKSNNPNASRTVGALTPRTRKVFHVLTYKNQSCHVMSSKEKDINVSLSHHQLPFWNTSFINIPDFEVNLFLEDSSTSYRDVVNYSF